MTASQIAAIRAEFPLIAKHDRVYFDNAATSQKPACVYRIMMVLFRFVAARN